MQNSRFNNALSVDKMQNSPLIYVRLDELKPYEKNPRKHPKALIDGLISNISEFGFTNPILITPDKTILAGHARYKAASEMGLTEIPARIFDGDTVRAAALVIADNRLAELSEWDDDVLADLITMIQATDLDIGFTGFDAASIDELFSKIHDKDVKDDECQIDPDAVTPFVQPGDIWTLGKHRMVCGDATKASDVALLMDGIKANLVVTDPPYNVSYESADGKTIQNDSMADGKFYEFLLSAFKNMAAHMAEGGSAYIFHADTEGLNFRRAFKEAGFHISGVCIWAKNSLVLGRSPYQWQHEPVLFGWLPNGKHRWFADRKQTTIWNFDKPKHSAQHPTMKPIPLLAYPIKNSSAPNGIVLDLFGGSGSTLVACEQSDRICRTMELDPKYATVIVQRYADLMESTTGIRVLRNGRELSFEEAAISN